MKYFLSSRTGNYLSSVLTGAIVLCLSGQSLAQTITVDELAEQISAGQTPFIIDLRRSHEFERSHIPGAVNIPISMLASKRLPPLGEVVVYGDGFGRVDEKKALTLLEDKNGIEPAYLLGGYAGWETHSGITTNTRGLSHASIGTITYQTLKESEGEGVIFYDLRKGVNRAGPKEELLEHFPRARLGKGSPYSLLRGRSREAGKSQQSGSAQGNPWLRAKKMVTDSLIVLVDDDHESAEKVAQRMKAGGFNRVAVLLGGDLILQHGGRPGLERRGGLSIPLNASSKSSKEDSSEPEEGSP